MAQGTHEEWILEPEKLECLVSTTRMDIVDHLAGRGSMSIKEIAAAVGKKPSALYHHIDKLLDAGLIHEEGSRTVNRRIEKLYATPSRRMRLRKALAEPANAEVMRRVVGALSRQADRDFARGIAGEGALAESEARNLGFYRMVAKPSPARLARVNQLLEEIGELFWEEDGAEEDAVVLTWVMAPAP
ncbi:MAG: helix-turn-helix domain-containing protein [Erythrobacter sp.]